MLKGPLGVVEAKKEGDTLTGVEVQTEKYSAGLPPQLPAWHRPLPFLYQATGVETRFTNALDPDPRSRPLFTFHRPETLLAWAQGLSSIATAISQVRELRRPTPHPGKLIRGKVASGLIEPRFFEIILNVVPSRDFIRFCVKTTAGLSGIAGSDLRRAPIPFAPLPEQHRIVAEVERHLSIISELEAAVKANLKRAERLRQAILKRAFEGKLVPHDPNDEPASLLLERIRKERDGHAGVHRVRRTRGRRAPDPVLDL